jgi:hypothetical protein
VRGEDAAIPITGVHEAPEDAFEKQKHDLPAFAPARSGENAQSAAQTLTTVQSNADAALMTAPYQKSFFCRTAPTLSTGSDVLVCTRAPE